eukprot:880288_1
MRWRPSFCRCLSVDVHLRPSFCAAMSVDVHFIKHNAMETIILSMSVCRCPFETIILCGSVCRWITTDRTSQHRLFSFIIQKINKSTCESHAKPQYQRRQK